MSSVGEQLRHERMRRNLGLGEVSEQTKIRPPLLEAIEADDWDRFRGVFFARSFVRQYARALGLDEHEFDAQLAALFAPPPPVADEPRPARVPAQQFAWPMLRSWLGPFVALASVLLAAWGAHLWWQRATHVLPVAAAPQLASPRDHVGPPPARDQLPSPPPAASAAMRAAESAPAPDGAVPAGRLVLEIAATERAWIAADADGRRAFSGMLNPGVTATIRASERIRLLTGNAASIQVRFNGQAVERLGRRGEVRRIEFTSQGFRFVPLDEALDGDE